jgi:hypothetical protein
MERLLFAGIKVFVSKLELGNEEKLVLKKFINFII